MAGRYGTVLLVLLAGVALGGDGPRAGIPRTAKFQQDVDAAIERGVAWLRNAQKADGSYIDFPTFDGATTALAYHTLRVCGVPRDDPAAKRAWDAGRRAYAKEKLRTYSAGVYLMAIASHGDPVAKATDDRDVRLSKEDAKWAREIAACLAGGQGEHGGWSYEVDTDADQGGSGAGSKVGGKPNRFIGSGDHSNTQYALLGLKCAARSGVPVDPGVWKRSLEHFLEVQEKSGPEVARGDAAPAKRPAAKGSTGARPRVDHARGWGYDVAGREFDHVSASMTAGGVSSVVICRSELLGTRAMTPKLDADSERSVWDGLAWLGTNWHPRSMDFPRDVELPPELSGMIGSGIDAYECYGVERAGVLAGVDWMAELDWYGAGADMLVAAQEKDGSWKGVANGLVVEPKAAATASRRVVDTCFALLFLKRGTTPVRRGAVTTQSGADDINFAAAATLEGKDLGDFLDLVLARWRRAMDAEVKTRLFDGATSAGPRIVEPLLVRMDDADAAVRNAAHALLQHATGQDFGFVADAKPELREVALVNWQKWWMSSKSGLVYDATAKKLVVR